MFADVYGCFLTTSVREKTIFNIYVYTHYRYNALDHLHKRNLLLNCI